MANGSSVLNKFKIVVNLQKSIMKQNLTEEALEIFAKYFSQKEGKSEIKVSGKNGCIRIILICGMFRIDIEYTPAGSQGFFKVGYKPHAMTTFFSTPNECGVSFEECCQQIKKFVELQTNFLNGAINNSNCD